MEHLYENIGTESLNTIAKENMRKEWLRSIKFKCHNRNRNRKKNRLNVSRLTRKKNRG